MQRGTTQFGKEVEMGQGEEEFPQPFQNVQQTLQMTQPLSAYTSAVGGFQAQEYQALFAESQRLQERIQNLSRQNEQLKQAYDSATDDLVKMQLENIARTQMAEEQIARTEFEKIQQQLQRAQQLSVQATESAQQIGQKEQELFARLNQVIDSAQYISYYTFGGSEPQPYQFVTPITQALYYAAFYMLSVIGLDPYIQSSDTPLYSTSNNQFDNYVQRMVDMANTLLVDRYGNEYLRRSNQAQQLVQQLTEIAQENPGSTAAEQANRFISILNRIIQVQNVGYQVIEQIRTQQMFQQNYRSMNPSWIFFRIVDWLIGSPIEQQTQAWENAGLPRTPQNLLLAILRLSARKGYIPRNVNNLIKAYVATQIVRTIWQPIWLFMKNTLVEKEKANQNADALRDILLTFGIPEIEANKQVNELLQKFTQENVDTFMSAVLQAFTYWFSVDIDKFFNLNHLFRNVIEWREFTNIIALVCTTVNQYINIITVPSDVYRTIQDCTQNTTTLEGEELKQHIQTYIETIKYWFQIAYPPFDILSVDQLDETQKAPLALEKK
jgi:hypothetical protein